MSGADGHMVTSERPRPLLVAVGDPDVHTAALAYATDVARRERRGLCLVHVIPPFADAGPEVMLLSFEDAQLVSDDLVHRAEKWVADETEGTVPVEAYSVRGLVVDVLVELAQDADKVVLQHRQQSRLRRVFTGSVAAGVAGRCTVPVVSVPETWSSGPWHQPRIAAGILGDDSDDTLLDHAFATAAEVRGTLTVLHAWTLPSPYDDARVGRDALREWGRLTSEQVGDRLKPWRSLYPDLDVRVRVDIERPADALVEQSRNSDLLLVGRSGGRHRVPHLGSLSRALIRESVCPVEIVPVRTGAEPHGPTA
jgi:nucleotide-binding universal stress UspA family protein